MIKNRCHPFLKVVVLWALLSPLIAYSQPVRNEVLRDVQIEDALECSRITIRFEFPIRYLRHFPESAGDELRIHLEPIAVNPGDAAALSRREAIKPSKSEIAPIVEVLYEGDITGGPYLTLTFTHPVQFHVGQGSDFRSLVVAVPLPETNLPCRPHGKKAPPGKTETKSR